MISQQSESTSFVGCRTELFVELSLSQTYENEMSEHVFSLYFLYQMRVVLYRPAHDCWVQS